MNRLPNVPRLMLGAALAFFSLASFGWAQQSAVAPAQSSIAPVPAHAPGILRPYLAYDVPPVRVANSPRLNELVRCRHAVSHGAGRHRLGARKQYRHRSRPL